MTDKEFDFYLFNLEVMMANCYFKNRPYEIDISNRPLETSVILNGRRVYSDTNTIADVATNYKRNGDYRESIRIYSAAIEEAFIKTDLLSIVCIRGLIKSLICANEFTIAFKLIKNVHEDLTARSNEFTIERFLFADYWFGIVKLIKTVVDDGDTSVILPYAANFSGNYSYQLQKSTNDIKNELAELRPLV